MLLHDETLTGATKQWIRERHYNAEWALSAQLEVLARQFDEMEDEYLRERKADLEQVVERLLGVAGARRRTALRRCAGSAVTRDFAGEDPLVLVANDISPADMLQFKRSVFTGFVTDVGGKTSHTAIVARSMDIPAVVGAREASRLIRQDDWVVIDGDAGVVDRRSVADRARGIPLPAAPARGRAGPAGAAASHAGGHARRRARRAARQHRAARRRRRGARGRRGRRRPVPQRVPVHEPRRRPARRGRAVRGLPQRGRGDARACR